MRINDKAQADDAKFVEDVLDDTRRDARIERLSVHRRVLGVVLIIQVVCLSIVMFVDVVSRATAKRPQDVAAGSPYLWAIVALMFASYLHTDLQIKFLKAAKQL